MARFLSVLVLCVLLLLLAATALHQWHRGRASQTLSQYADSRHDPCLLPRSPGLVDSIFPYLDLDSLVNDVDLVVVGHPTKIDAVPPDPWTLASRAVSTIEIDRVVAGEASARNIRVDSGLRVMSSGHGLELLSLDDLDLCKSGSVLLFLGGRDARTNEYGVAAWARIDGTAFTAPEYNGIYSAVHTTKALTDKIRQLAIDQATQQIQKGRLLCESMRHSPRYVDPVVCPGDRFNPYEALRLDRPMAQASILFTDPGPSPLATGKIDISTGQVGAILRTLNGVITLTSLTTPDDAISLFAESSEPLGGQTSVRFDYSPSAHVVWLPRTSGGGFPAPPAFEAAMKPFVAQQQSK